MKPWLTPEAVEGAYNFIKSIPPFSGWKLPDADDLEFKVTRHNDRYSHFEYDVGKWQNIAVSERHVKTVDDLIAALAHECIHIKQWKAGAADKRVQHNREFKRLAKGICARLGFDAKTF